VDKMRATTISIGLALASSVAMASAYTRTDAQHVTSSKNRAVLDYVVCLEDAVGRTPKSMSIMESLEAAEHECSEARDKLPNSATEPTADDLRLMILECGFRAGDASPDAGC
jgi:hypothetical protein